MLQNLFTRLNKHLEKIAVIAQIWDEGVISSCLHLFMSVHHSCFLHSGLLQNIILPTNWTTARSCNSGEALKTEDKREPGSYLSDLNQQHSFHFRLKVYETNWNHFSICQEYKPFFFSSWITYQNSNQISHGKNTATVRFSGCGSFLIHLWPTYYWCMHW